MSGVRFCFTSLFSLPVRVRKSLSNGLRHIKIRKNGSPWPQRHGGSHRGYEVYVLSWDVSPQTSLHRCQHFRGTRCLHLQGRIGGPQVLHGVKSHRFLFLCLQQSNTNDELPCLLLLALVTVIVNCGKVQVYRLQSVPAFYSRVPLRKKMDKDIQVSSFIRGKSNYSYIGYQCFSTDGLRTAAYFIAAWNISFSLPLRTGVHKF